MNAISANDTGLPGAKSLRLCQHDAVLLAGLIKAIGYLDSENSESGAMVCLIQIAEERAEALANDLERVMA